MRFIINILANQALNEQSLGALVQNIQSQPHQSTVEMVMLKTAAVTDQSAELIKNTKLPVKLVNDITAVELDATEDTYWMNLAADDCLLPNAILQWENALSEHATDLLLLTSLNNQSKLSDQLAPMFEKLGDVNQETLKSVFQLNAEQELSALPLQKQLQLMLAAQSYYVNDLASRYRTFFNQVDLKGRNVLYRLNAKHLNTEREYVAQIRYDLIENDDYVKLNLPTLILNSLSAAEEVRLTVQLIDGVSAIFDDAIANYYLAAIAHRINGCYQLIDEGQLNANQRRALVADLNHARNQLPLETQRKIHRESVKTGVVESLKNLL